jgi:hypothetical protein
MYLGVHGVVPVDNGIDQRDALASGRPPAFFGDRENNAGNS